MKMRSRIYRDAALEKLSSPDELDHLLKITDSKIWMFQLALAGLLILAIEWGYRGRLPSVVRGQGVIIRKGGVLNIVSAGSGVLDDVHVEVGDKIKIHQVLARIAQPAMEEKLSGAENALSEAEREKQRSHAVLESEARLTLETIQRKRANTEREIAQLEQQLVFAKEHLAAQESLLTAQILTKQQTMDARQNVATIEAQVANFQAELKELSAQEFSTQGRVSEVDGEKELRIQDLRRTVSELKTELNLAENVASPYSGEVLEMKVSKGATVAAGQPLLSIQPDIQDLHVLVYVPAAQAKNVKIGMGVKISPTTVRPEEFGFIKGKVDYVSDFPDTPAELMRNFENEVLVNSLTQAGPVTELHVEMERNVQTPSGFQWSSPRGPSLTISAGTFCTAEIVTRWQAPITLVLPFLKKSLGLT
jgi:HlyD family secretion protein